MGLRAEPTSRLRLQMTTSVAEKRQKGCAAACDMHLDPGLLRAVRAEKKSNRGGYAKVSASVRCESLHQGAALSKAPVIKSSGALFSSPAPARVALTSVASPLSTRAVSTQGVLEPDWDLLET